VSGIFDDHVKKYDAWYEKNAFAYLSELKAVKKVVPKGGRGLEIGVGTGRFAAPLGIETGIDPSKNMIALARRRGVQARLGCGEKLPFKREAFDYIAIIITLCFLRDPEKVLKESRRVLRKNGKIIIAIVDKDSFLGRYYQKKKSVFYGQAHFFNIREVAGLLRKAGFSGFSYYQTVTRLPEKMRSIEEVRRGSGKGGFVVVSAEKRRGNRQKDQA